MNTEIVITGISHRETGIELRELFSLPRERWEEISRAVLGLPHAVGAVVVSTCNRMEVISAVRGGEQALAEYQSEVVRIFEQISSLPRTQFAEQLYQLHGLAAASHLFRVAAGLDSLVVGEPQILGQLKDAYQFAKAQETTTYLLNRLFHRAFGVAKSIRTNTKIGHHAVSVCYAAKELAKQIFGELSEARVMLIGAGEMGVLAVKHLQAAQVKTFFIVNRTLERAYEVAERVSGVPLSLENFKNFLHEADIVIGASNIAASNISEKDSFLVSEDDAAQAQKQRPGKPQFFIDLGVPRNFAPTLNNIQDAFLYNIDDLRSVVDRNMEQRVLEVERAEVIVADELEKFAKWLRLRSFGPTMKELHSQLQRFQAQEMRKSLKRLRMLGYSEEDCQKFAVLLTDYSAALLSKVLHRPVTYAKQTASFNPAVETLFRELFLTSAQPEVGSEVEREGVIEDSTGDDSLAGDDAGEVSVTGTSKSCTRRGSRL